MSKEKALREELDKERQQREEIEQKYKESLTTENSLRKEVSLLREQLASMNPETNQKKHGVPGNLILPTTGQNEDSNFEAITDLHFDINSPATSSNSRGTNNSGTSPSFEIIGRGPSLQSLKRKEAQASKWDSDAEPGNLKSSQPKPARVPVQSSAQHDSRLTFRPAPSEGSPQDMDKVILSQYDVVKMNGVFEKGDPSGANSWPQQSDPWNGTGARPKNNSFPSNNPRTEDSERNPETEGQHTPAAADLKVGQNSKMLVQIPKDGGSYRINQHPPNNFGKDMSMTGISSIFTSSEEEMPATRKQTGSMTGALELNDLSSGTPRSIDKSRSPQMESLNKSKDDTALNEQTGSKELREQELLLMNLSSPYQSIDMSNDTGQIQVSSEDVHLASQLDSLVLEMKSKVLDSEECIDRFASYAGDVDKLETRLKEYEAQIQKHQVYSSSLQSHIAEVQQLRMENEGLKQLLQQYTILSSGPESGWVSVTMNKKEHKQEEIKALEEKLKDLTALNNQLFTVNRQWEESWKTREQQFTTQQEDLDSKVEQLTKENEQLKEQSEEVSQLKEELQTLKHERHELEQKFTVQESHLLKEQKMNSKLRSKWDSYNNAKGDMEIKMKELLDKSSDLATEKLVLQDQLTVMMEDFQKEKKDKTVLEEQLRKWRAEKGGLKEKKYYEARIKNADNMIKKRDEEILSKDKTLGHLQRTIDDLKAQLRMAERRTVIQPPSLFQSAPPSDVFCPSASPAYNPSQMKLLQEQRELTDNSMLPSYSTLHSRDEWPGRDVPDMPGQINVT